MIPRTYTLECTQQPQVSDDVCSVQLLDAYCDVGRLETKRSYIALSYYFVGVCTCNNIVVLRGSSHFV